MKMNGQPIWEPELENINVDLKQAFEQLQSSWESVGYTKETQIMYYKQACNHIKDLLNDMVAESQTKEQQLLENIKELLKLTTTLYSELHVETMPKTYEQLPLNQVEQMLRLDLQNLEYLKEQRLMVLKELIAKEHDVCWKLGAASIGIGVNDIPTEQELESFKLYLQKQENEKNHLESIFTEMRCSVVKMIKDLGITPSSSFEHLVCDNPKDFVLSTNNMTKLREFKDQLKTQVEEAKCYVENIKEELLALWKYLDEPPDTYMPFLNKYCNIHASSRNALSQEIKRCKEKRKEDIFKYVTQMRAELVNIWDLCKYCEAERNSFAPFHSNTFTEDLLTLHELEVERLRKFYNENEMIFQFLGQHESFLNKIKELLQRANNPDRFHNRGGQLLLEEKERKVIQKKLPKIEAELRHLIKEYENKHNKIFTIYGTSLEEVLAESWKSINVEKETIQKARKEAKDKSIKKSPLNNSKKTPCMNHLSIPRGPTSLSKRKLCSPSPNTSTKRRYKNSDKNKPTVIVSKVRRSGRLGKIVSQKGHKSSKDGRKSNGSLSASITDTTYNQFQGHMTDREELHSSLLPKQVLRSTNQPNIKTPVRTPAKPLRKNLSITVTPTRNLSARKAPNSPRIVNTPKLATAPTNLPFIF